MKNVNIGQRYHYTDSGNDMIIQISDEDGTIWNRYSIIPLKVFKGSSSLSTEYSFSTSVGTWKLLKNQDRI